MAGSELDFAPVAEPAHIGMCCFVGCRVLDHETAEGEIRARFECDMSWMTAQMMVEKRKLADTLD